MDRQGRQGVQGIQGIQGVEGRGTKGDRGEPGKYEALHRWRWRALMVWCIGFTFISFFSIRENRLRSSEGIRATLALCEIKRNLELRITRTQDFLKSNPGPIVLGNVPRKTIENSLATDKSTNVALEKLNCPPIE